MGEIYKAQDTKLDLYLGCHGPFRERNYMIVIKLNFGDGMDHDRLERIIGYRKLKYA